MKMDKLEILKSRLEDFEPYQKIGSVNKIIGLTIESKGPDAFVGELCKIITEEKKSYAEVVGFNETGVLLMPLEDISGLKKGCQILRTKEYVSVPVSDELLGKVIDPLGRPLDGSKIISKKKVPIVRNAPNPLIRKRITTPISVGIRAIDRFLTLGYGQRIGIFAGSGVGKSTLLGMIARNTSADINVISLIGERGS